MCIVKHVEMKSVFTFQPMQRLVSTTVKSAMPAVTFWIFVLGTKNWQLCCLAVTVHIVLPERRVAITKKESHLHFWRNFSANHNQVHLNLIQKSLKWVPIRNKRMRFLLVDDLSHIFFFSNHFMQFQSTVNLHLTYTKSSWSSQSPTTESSGLSILDPTLLLLQ